MLKGSIFIIMWHWATEDYRSLILQVPLHNHSLMIQDAIQLFSMEKFLITKKFVHNLKIKIVNSDPRVTQKCCFIFLFLIKKNAWKNWTENLHLQFMIMPMKNYL